jgi:hypothetical protein
MSLDSSSCRMANSFSNSSDVDSLYGLDYNNCSGSRILHKIIVVLYLGGTGEELQAHYG